MGRHFSYSDPEYRKKQAEITRKYCCIHCLITTIGRRTTSPKASKGKPGVRIDVSPAICFYSTWEANIARVFNLVGIKWVYAPKIFNLGEHTYRPDFYLPDFDSYLELILKKEYTEIKFNYKYFMTSSFGG